LEHKTFNLQEHPCRTLTLSQLSRKQLQKINVEPKKAHATISELQKTGNELCFRVYFHSACYFSWWWFAFVALLLRLQQSHAVKKACNFKYTLTAQITN